MDAPSTFPKMLIVRLLVMAAGAAMIFFLAWFLRLDPVKLALLISAIVLVKVGLRYRSRE